jgi:hypothetical protein
MDILEESQPTQEILPIMNALRFKDTKIRLVGTGALKSQLYPADYDFLNLVGEAYKPAVVYREFKRILNKLQKLKDYFFIELKFQSKDGEKTKIFKIDEFNEDLFNKAYTNIDYMKIDGITTIKGEFKEVSCIYFLTNTELDNDKYIRVLLDDQKHYYDEKKYYKSLKRIMLASKRESPPDKNLIITISKLFNSETGRLYKLKNMIDAIIIFLDKYKGKQDIKRAENFLIDNGLKGVRLEDLQKLSDDYGKLIDEEGLKFYKAYNIPVGNLPKYNSIKGKGKGKYKKGKGKEDDEDEKEINEFMGSGFFMDFLKGLSSGTPLPLLLYRMKKQYKQ